MAVGGTTTVVGVAVGWVITVMGWAVAQCGLLVCAPLPQTGLAVPGAGHPPPLGLFALQPVGSGVWHCAPEVGLPFSQLPVNPPLLLPLFGLPAFEELPLLLPGVPLLAFAVLLPLDPLLPAFPLPLVPLLPAFPLLLRPLFPPLLLLPLPPAASVVLAKPVCPELRVKALVARTRARLVAAMSRRMRFIK